MAGMHTPLRIALAVLVTLWSPAWCQCMLLAAMHDDHPAHAAPDQESSNAATAELQCDSDACCDAFAPQTLSLMQCCPGDCNAPVGAPCACECCDQTVTGAQAPAQQSATFTVALCALDALLDSAVVAQAGARFSVASDDAPPRTMRSLYAHRCLLLI